MHRPAEARFSEFDGQILIHEPIKLQVRKRLDRFRRGCYLYLRSPWRPAVCAVLAAALADKARLALALGQYAEAERTLQEGLDMLRAALGPARLPESEDPFRLIQAPLLIATGRAAQAADALREHVSRHGPTPLYLVVGRGGPNLIRGMGAMRDTAEALGIPYRIFGFDSDMGEVINYARKADAWMKAGGREKVEQAMRGGTQSAVVKAIAA